MRLGLRLWCGRVVLCRCEVVDEIVRGGADML